MSWHEATARYSEIRCCETLRDLRHSCRAPLIIRTVKNDKKPEILDKNPSHGSCDTLFNPKRPPFRPKEEGADHVRLEFPLAGVARKTLHLKVAGISPRQSVLSEEKIKGWLNGSNCKLCGAICCTLFLYAARYTFSCPHRFVPISF